MFGWVETNNITAGTGAYIMNKIKNESFEVVYKCDCLESAEAVKEQIREKTGFSTHINKIITTREIL